MASEETVCTKCGDTVRAGMARCRRCGTIRQRPKRKPTPPESPRRSSSEPRPSSAGESEPARSEGRRLRRAAHARGRRHDVLRRFAPRTDDRAPGNAESNAGNGGKGAECRFDVRAGCHRRSSTTAAERSATKLRSIHEARGTSPEHQFRPAAADALAPCVSSVGDDDPDSRTAIRGDLVRFDRTPKCGNRRVGTVEGRSVVGHHRGVSGRDVARDSTRRDRCHGRTPRRSQRADTGRAPRRSTGLDEGALRVRSRGDR